METNEVFIGMVREAAIRELDRRNFQEFQMEPHKGVFNYDPTKSDPDDGVFWFYADTGDSFNLGWTVCIFVSDFDPANTYGGGGQQNAKPTLRGIVEWLEGDVLTLTDIPNRNI